MGGGVTAGRGAGCAEFVTGAGGALATCDVPLAHQTTVAAIPRTNTAPDTMSAMIAGREERVRGWPEMTVGEGVPDEETATGPAN